MTGQGCRHVSFFPAAPAARERSLPGRGTAVDREARNHLAVENLPLVGYLVSDLCRRAPHLSREDLASVGALALVTAVRSFDPEQGVKFGTFARHRVLGAFADEMRAGDWASRGTRGRIKSVRAVGETLTGQLGRTPTEGVRWFV